jgi:zinc protease
MLAAKQISLSQWIYWYQRGFSGTASTGDLKTLFEMLYLNFTNPRIEPDPVQIMIGQYSASLAHKNEVPQTVFFDEVSRTVFSNHPRFMPLELADLSKININASLAFLRRAMNPADYTFVFTGNINIGIMRDYVQTYLSSIPRGESWNEWTDLGFSRPGKIDKNVYKGKDDQSIVFLAWYTRAPHSEELSIASWALNGYLDILLNDEIREKLGGVYSISAYVSARNVPRDELSVEVIFACDPKRTGELSAAVIGLLNKTAGPGGIDRNIFNKAVEALKKEHETSMQSNTHIAKSYANSSVILRAPLSRLERRPGYFSAVTPEDVRRVCAQLMQGNNGPVQVTLYPEK